MSTIPPSDATEGFSSLSGLESGIHSKIIDLGVNLEYFKDRRGACKGVTMAWLSACLMGDEQKEVYGAIIKKINDDEGDALFNKIKTMKAKASRKEELTHEEKELFQVLAFYEKVALYMDPDKYIELFGKPLNQGDIGAISSLATDSGKSLFEAYSESCIFDEAELTAYLTQLVGALDPGTGTIALSISNHNHNLGLAYNTINRSWQLMDINQGGPKVLSIEEISKRIMDGFNVPSHSPRFEHTGMSVHVITTSNNEKRAQVESELKAFKKSYRAARETRAAEIVTREGTVNLLWIAVSIGDRDTLEMCINNCPPEARQKIFNISYLNVTLLCAAAQHGDVEVVKALIKALDIDLNKPTASGASPLAIAAMNGHIDIVKALLAAPGINVNQSNPLASAVRNGHIGIVKALLAAPGINVNQSDLLFNAAMGGHIDVVKALLEAGATWDIDLGDDRIKQATSIITHLERKLPCDILLEELTRLRKELIYPSSFKKTLKRIEKELQNLVMNYDSINETYLKFERSLSELTLKNKPPNSLISDELNAIKLKFDNDTAEQRMAIYSGRKI